MEVSTPLYVVVIGAVVVLGVIVLLIRRGRPHAPAGNPYVDALRNLIEGESDRAFHKLQDAVKQGYAPTDAYIKLGELLRERGEVAKALQIHQSLTVKTNLTRREKIELFLNLAEDYARMGKSDKSVKVLESAIRNLEITDPAVYMTLAKHQHLLGATEKAYEALREARKQGAIGDRELALYLTTVAERMLDKGDTREARKTLQRALKHDPNCAPCLLVLGDIAEKLENHDEAIDRWRRVAMLSPELSEEALRKLERTLFERGRFGEIERVYDQVRSTRIGDEAAVLALAAFYKKQGRGDRAIELLEEYIAVYPGSFRAGFLLASLYAKYRDTDTLEQFLDRAVRESWQSNHFQCRVCKFQSDNVRWHCPRCNAFDSFSQDHEL